MRANPDGRNVGIDISRGTLGKAERRLAKAGLSHFELFQRTAVSIAETDDAFDVLLNNYMFDLVDQPDQARVIAEFHRVLKPGGRLVLANMTLAERAGPDSPKGSTPFRRC
ncbi:MAG: class I SAM-dependent methyltransferase [Gammaproteobacteria bacterium]